MWIPRGIYINLGQVLSVMGTFLPVPYLAAFEQLQDAVPPRRYGTCESIADGTPRSTATSCAR